MSSFFILLLIIEGDQDRTQTGRKLKAGADTEVVEECFLLACSPQLAHHALLQKSEPLTTDWALPNHSLIKNIPYRIARNRSLFSFFITFSFSLNSSLLLLSFQFLPPSPFCPRSTPLAFPSEKHSPPRNINQTWNMACQVIKKKKKTQTYTLILRLDESTQYEGPKSRTKSQRQLLLHCQETHKNTKLQNHSIHAEDLGQSLSCSLILDSVTVCFYELRLIASVDWCLFVCFLFAFCFHLCFVVSLTFLAPTIFPSPFPQDSLCSI